MLFQQIFGSINLVPLPEQNFFFFFFFSLYKFSSYSHDNNNTIRTYLNVLNLPKWLPIPWPVYGVSMSCPALRACTDYIGWGRLSADVSVMRSAHLYHKSVPLCSGG